MKTNKKFVITLIITGILLAFLISYLLLFWGAYTSGREGRFLMAALMLVIVAIIVMAVRVMFIRIKEIKEEDDDYRNY